MSDPTIQHPTPLHLAIVGGEGGTNVGESLRRAANRQGHRVTFFNARDAMSRMPVLQSVLWRFDCRPVHLDRVSANAVRVCGADRPRLLISTGPAPITAPALQQLKALGIRCINFSTDDPWNRAVRAAWYLRALPHYDTVFTPRTANLQDFEDLGCHDVRHLCFGYDDELFAPVATERIDGEPVGHGLTTGSPEVLFVVGADSDRVSFISEFMRHGPAPSLVGDYWSRFPATRPHDLGHKDADTLRRLTAAAAVNVCLVRRANRDGHVMRTFEIPAVGGFMLAEDTTEHRALFGAEGRNVLYFSNAHSAAEQAQWALQHPTDRRRMAHSAQTLVTHGGHSYRDRLDSMLAAVSTSRL